MTCFVKSVASCALHNRLPAAIFPRHRLIFSRTVYSRHASDSNRSLTTERIS